MGKVSTEMGKLSFARLAAAIGGVGLALSAGAGIASADVNAVINSPCDYPHVMNALYAKDRGAYARFKASAVAQSYLQQFIASAPPQRAAMVTQLQAIPGASDYFVLVENVADTCMEDYPPAP